MDLSRRVEISFGDTLVRPSLRTVVGPTGTSTIEPRVMQVLLTLYDAEGAVLSRNDLLEQCWGGVVVGDDSINRTISEIRRVVRETGAQFEIETVPRVGYRFCELVSGASPSARTPSFLRRMDRRQMVVGGICVAAISAGGATFAARLSRASEVDALIERGRLAQATSGLNAHSEAEPFFRSAIEIDSERADAWGWLARVTEEPNKARESALKALSLDSHEPNAKVVLINQRQDLDDWAEWEDSLQEVLDYAPDNTLALATLSHFYQCVGRCKDNWEIGERCFKLEPFSPGSQHRRAYRHWIFGKLAQADKIIDQCLRLWPRHPYVWNARLLIYAFTDRAQAALSLIEDVESRPADLSAPSIDSWRAALLAINTRSSADIMNAVEVCTSAASLAPGLAVNAIMAFSYLGELDSAYRVADGLFVGRGTVVQQLRGEGIRDTYSEPGWGRTQALFIPATAAFRSDERFFGLCERMGHVSYWRKRGIWPDPFVRGSLNLS